MITEQQRQLRKTRIGSSDAAAIRSLPLTQDTLAAHVDVMPSGCWHWKGKPESCGYGRKQWKGRTQKAHRAVWEAVNGPIPSGKKVLHRCDNRICVNPAHLFLGTTMDNWRDCTGKDRHYRGERVKQAKLTADQVREIRLVYRWRSPTSGIPALARRFGVSVAVIGKVINRRLWKHVA